MKSKLKKISIIFTLLSMMSVLCLGLFTFKDKESVYAAAGDTVSSYYLDVDGEEGDDPYKSIVEAGTTSGYGRYRVDATNVVLTTSANTGFEFKYWYVMIGATTQIITEDTEIEGVDFSITTADTDSDQYNDSSTITLSSVVKDMYVEPVYDYIYYNIDLDGFYDNNIPKNVYIGELSDNTVGTTYGEQDVNFYYKSTSSIVSGAGNITVYHNVICSWHSSTMDYLGDVYTKDGVNFYKLYDKNDGSGDKVAVDIKMAVICGGGYYRALGFRYGDIVEIARETNCNDAFANNQYVKINDFNKTTGSTIESYEIRNNETHDYTESFSVKLEINGNTILDANVIELNKVIINTEMLSRCKNATFAMGGGGNEYYSDLYVVDGGLLGGIPAITINEGRVNKFYLDAVALVSGDFIQKDTISGSLRSKLLEKIDIDTNSRFAKLGANQYLIDASKTTININYSNLQGSNSNPIYDAIYMLNNSTANETAGRSIDINGDNTLTVYYSPSVYEINYQFRKLEGSDLVDVGGENQVHATKYVKPGTTITFETDYPSEPTNVGYTFKAYYTSITPYETLDSVTIDKNAPTDQTVYMAYEAVAYELYLKSSLNYLVNPEGATIYPISSLSRWNGREYEGLNIGGSIQAVGQSLNYKLGMEEGLYITGFNLGSQIKIKLQLNAGFNVESLSVAGFEFNNEGSGVFTRTMDSEFIGACAQYIDADTPERITVNIIDSYVEYKLEYYIETLISEGDEIKKMAHIDVENTSEYAEVSRYYSIDKDGYGNYTQNTDDGTGIVQAIMITGLRLYDTVTLKSTPQEYAEGRHYLFGYYRKGYAAMDYESISDESKTEFTCDETILQDTIIEVKYSMADSQITLSSGLLVGYTDDEILALDNFEVYRDRELQTINGETLEINFKDDDDDTNIVINVYLEGTRFGYRNISDNRFSLTGERAGIDIYYDPSELNLEFQYDSATNMITISFVVMTDGTYNLNINFELIQYLFVLDDEKNIYEDRLTIQDMELNFIKPEGMYVSNITSGNDGTSITSPDMRETNDKKTEDDKEKFSFTFANVDMFKTFLTRYSSVGTDTVNLGIEYTPFTYSVTVKFELVSAKGVQYENHNYPNAELDGEYASSALSYDIDVFNGINFGENVTLNINYANSYGLSRNRWKYENNSTVENVENKLTKLDDTIILSNIDNDYIFVYQMSYINYNFQFNYESNEGQPVIKVGSPLVEFNSFSQFDTVQINSVSNVNCGFNVNGILTEYKYTTPEKYMEDLNNNILYIRDGANTTLATVANNATYDDSLIYLVKLNGDKESVVNFDKINLADFVLQTGNKINLYFTYTLKEVLITNLAEYSTLSTLKAGKDKYLVDFNVEDVAQYTITATDSRLREDGSREIEDGAGVVTYYDTVRVEIRINDQAEEVYSHKKYDLRSIVNLSASNQKVVLNITIGGKSYEIVDLGDGVYELVFSMGDIITSIDENITLKYYYLINQIKVTTTTNIGNKSFYQNNPNLFKLIRVEYGFGTDLPNGRTNPFEVNTAFLTTARVVYNLTGSYATLFKVSGVRIYDEYGVQIDLNNDIYKEMITIDWNDHDVSIVDHVLLSRLDRSIKIELIVQPIIKILNEDTNIYETIAVGNTYDIEKDFICDENAIAQVQTLKIGSNEDFVNEIVVPDMIKDAIELKYFDRSGWQVSEPKNAGAYTVVLTFSSLGDYKWLEEFSDNLNCTIRLVINQKTVTFEYDPLKVTQYEKTYDGSYEFNVDVLKNCLTVSFTDYKGINRTMSYTEAIKTSLFSLSGSEYALITLGGDSITKADESMYYDVTIYDLGLRYDIPQNLNFTLSRNSLTIGQVIKINKVELNVEGIIVKDKVLDTNVATAKDAVVDISGATFTNLVGSDNVSLDASKITARFELATEGQHNVSIDLSNALTGIGTDYENYKIGTATGRATIYPYAKTCTINGVGTFTIKNDRGLVDPELASIIPVNSILMVELVNETHKDLPILRRSIAPYLSRMNVYGMGLKFYIMLGTEKYELDNRLILVTPEFSEMNELLWSNEETGKVDYTRNEEDSSLVIDLNQMPKNLTYLVITEHRDLLELWQIILIISVVVFVIVAVVITIIVIRRKREIKDSKYDTI